MEYLARNSVGSTFGRDKVVYTVRSGDVLGIIAQRYRVRVSDIKKWNRLPSNMIRVGQRLNLWLYPGSQPKIIASSMDEKLVPSTINFDEKEIYTVQPGDTLWDIANKFEGLDSDKIKKLNKLKNSRIMPGQILIVG